MRAFMAYLGFLLLPLAVASLSASDAWAVWPHDTYNGNVAVCDGFYEKAGPSVASDGAGGAIVAWYDFRDGAYGLYAQRVGAEGRPRWAANGVILGSGSGALIADGAGGAIACWGQSLTGMTDLYAQRLDAMGARQWGPGGVAVCIAAGYQQFVVLASDGAGGAIIAWEDSRPGLTFDIYVQRVNAAGSVLWASGGVGLCTVSGNQRMPVIVADGSGGAIVAWTDTRSGATGDIYAQRVNAAGTAVWTAGGLALCVAAGSQGEPVLASDGSGGVLATWSDYRGGGSGDIYAQRVSAAGLPLWPADGIGLCVASGAQGTPGIVSDGSGGAIVAWHDARDGGLDIYAQRVNAFGATQWAANGTGVCWAPGDQDSTGIVPDGAGGAILTWNDGRTSENDIYAQRLSAAGAPLWTPNGVALCTAPGRQTAQVIAGDGGGGAIVAWQDWRRGVVADIYAQRVERFGYLGPEPLLASARDVPGDEGGQVKVTWQASWLDAALNSDLSGYDVYRAAPDAVMRPAVDDAASARRGFAGLSRTGELRFSPAPEGDALYAWEYLATVTARHFTEAYSFIAPTTADSTAAGHFRTAFLVVARNADGTRFWPSEPESACSADNLAPLMPGQFVGNSAGSALLLRWAANSEADLAGYRLYRGDTAGFPPDAANRIAQGPETNFVDVTPGAHFYKLAAADVHGNESAFALLTPGQVGGAPEAGPPVLSLGRAVPNPARGAPVTIAFSLSRTSFVHLAIYDVAGARVRTLMDGLRPEGPAAVAWDGRDDRGAAVGSGLYFYRLEAQGKVMTDRLVMAR